MFAYCNNSPINLTDSSGNLPVRNTMLMTSDSGYNAQARAYLANRQLGAVQNYRHNAAADCNTSTTTTNRVLNDQYGITGNSFQYGSYGASWNGCGAIAVHNAKVLLGEESSLSNIIFDFEQSGIDVCNGFWGSNPFKLGKVLKKNGLSYTNVGRNKISQPGVYVIAYWTGFPLFSSMHFVAVTYDGTEYTTYNYSGKGSIEYLNPQEYARNYVWGYYLR